MATDATVPPTNVDVKGDLRRVVRGFGGLAAGSLISQLIGFAALLYVARRTGATNLGAYTFALLLATYFNLFASLGIDYLATRDIAQGTNSLGSIVGETLVLQGALSVILYIALVALAPVLATNHEVERMIPIVGLILLTTTFTLDWALFALGRSHSIALWRLIGQVVYAALVPLLVIGGRSGIFHYAWLTILGLVVTSLGLMLVFLRVATTRLHVSGPRALLLRLHRSMPFAYSLVMIQIYGGIGTLMLGYLDSTHAVGIYAVASKLPWALIAFANLWLNVFFPHTAQRLLADASGFAHDLGRIVTATIVIAAAATVGALLCAGTLMVTLFGASFQAASVPFALLSGAAALVLLQANFSNVLLAGGSQRYYAVVVTIAAACIVLFNLILIPLLGTLGAAIATLCGEIGLTTLTLVGVRRRLGPFPLEAGRLFRGAGAVGLMALAMMGARSLGGAVVQIGVALPTFVAAAWLFRVFDRALIHR
jgi:O-antigen/teichoic acid export membrane protein